MTDTIPARLAALKTASLPELKAQWRELFGAEPPGYNRRFLESRLAYRIQEVILGGLRPETANAPRGARRAVRRPHRRQPWQEEVALPDAYRVQRSSGSASLGPRSGARGRRARRE